MKLICLPEWAVIFFCLIKSIINQLIGSLRRYSYIYVEEWRRQGYERESAWNVFKVHQDEEVNTQTFLEFYETTINYFFTRIILF